MDDFGSHASSVELSAGGRRLASPSVAVLEASPRGLRLDVCALQGRQEVRRSLNVFTHQALRERDADREVRHHRLGVPEPAPACHPLQLGVVRGRMASSRKKERRSIQPHVTPLRGAVAALALRLSASPALLGFHFHPRRRCEGSSTRYTALIRGAGPLRSPGQRYGGSLMATPRSPSAARNRHTSA